MHAVSRVAVAAALVMLLAPSLSASAAATPPDTAAAWPPTDCYEGHASPRGSLIGHDVLVCRKATKAHVEIYLNTVLVTRRILELETEEIMDLEGGTQVRAETWTMETRGSLTLVQLGQQDGRPLFWRPAAGTGHVDEWNLALYRYYP